ncbi:MAG: hypothetical protein J5J06_15260 [Phycisphaerae bacterium]|nr:hypothetical protein [Phycisphaerae bacterium]
MDTSRKGRLGFLTAAVLLAVGTVVAQASGPECTASTEEASALVPLGDGAGAMQVTPLPHNQKYILHTDSGQTQVLRSPLAADPDKIVYKNTRGTFLYSNGSPGISIADDASTYLLDNCGISRLRVFVNGGVVGGGSEFRAVVDLYTACPQAGGTQIPLSSRTFLNLDNDIAVTHVLEATYDPAQVQIPSTVWVRVRFSAAPGNPLPTKAGWVGGSPPDRGFSVDAFYNGVSLQCNSFFGGSPAFPHGSFNMEIYADEACPSAYVAYYAVNPNAGAFLDINGGQTFADDIQLALPPGGSCEVASYRVGFKATSFSITDFNITTGLRTLGSGAPIGGSEFSRHYELNPPADEPERRFVVNQLIEHRYIVPDNVFINLSAGTRYYVTWTIDRNGIGVVNPSKAQVGTTQNTFWSINPDWQLVQFQGNVPAIMYIVVTCRGEAPTGACCPLQEGGLDRPACTIDQDCPENRYCETVSCTTDADCPQGTCNVNTCTSKACSEAVCFDTVDAITCAEVDGRWVASGLCKNNPFNPPCGTQACCRPGDACDDLTFSQCQAIVDPDSPTVSCTTDADCFPNRTCQPNNLCSPRTAIWNPGAFCDDFDFNCGFFACLYSTNDCYTGIPEVTCNQEEITACTARKCTADFECSSVPYTGHCKTVSGIAGKWCTSSVCGDWACTGNNANPQIFQPGQCEIGFPDDALCADLGPSFFCDSVSRVCTTGQDTGCENVECCNDVCSFSGQDGLFCCTSAWDEVCAGFASDLCGTQSAFDFCYCRRCSISGQVCEVDGNCPLPNETCDISSACGPTEILVSPTTGIGSAVADNSNATTETDDPILCCSKLGAGAQGAGSIWFKFTMPLGLGTSARIHTCNTPGAIQDSVLQLFSVGDMSDAEKACQSLEAIACSDDFPGCGGGLGADICAKNLTPGATYYVMMASKVPTQQTDFELRIEVPCTRNLPTADACETTTSSVPSGADTTAAFSLASSTMECPNEPCVPAMVNDVWLDHTPSCTGNLTVDTCGTPAGQNNPATTLAVYQVLDPFNPCPPDLLLGCNDDAEVSAAAALLRPQSCSLTQTSCNTAADCASVCTNTLTPCTSTANCNACSGDPNRPCLSNTDCKTCLVGGAPCTVNADCGVGGVCVQVNTCTVSGNTCQTQSCLSSCGDASSVTVPVFAGSFLKLRVGGELGGTPSGNVRVRCMPDDCNANGVPDAIDIQINGDCNNNGEPDDCDIANGWADCQPDGIPDRCQIAVGSPAPGGPFFCTENCKTDANDDGVPDECVVTPCSIVSALPAGCAIDAGQPHALDSAAPPQGWSSVEITFDGSCDASTLTTGSFTIATQPGPASAPTITNVSGVGNVATLTFSAPIPTNQWTCVTHSGTDVCFGYLPGDVDGNRTASETDVTALIASLDGTTPRPDYATDINRSGAPTVADITRLIDVLNGGNTYNAWKGQGISIACPAP